MEAASSKPRVLLAASGSVATVKVPELAARLAEVVEVPRWLSDSRDASKDARNQACLCRSASS